MHLWRILLRGTGIVVPKVLRDKVVRLAHEGHQGLVKTKYRLRSKVWWPGMDKDVENLCKVCHDCQVTSSCDPPDPMSRVLPPSGPWQDCGADLLGPVPTGENRELKQTTTATATATPSNKRFNEQNNSCARAF